MSKHYDDLLINYFGIEKTRKLIAWKYYGPALKVDIESYVKRCDVCLTPKLVRYKFYSNL